MPGMHWLRSRKTPLWASGTLRSHPEVHTMQVDLHIPRLKHTSSSQSQPTLHMGKEDLWAGPKKNLEHMRVKVLAGKELVQLMAQYHGLNGQTAPQPSACTDQLASTST